MSMSDFLKKIKASLGEILAEESSPKPKKKKKKVKKKTSEVVTTAKKAESREIEERIEEEGIEEIADDNKSDDNEPQTSGASSQSGSGFANRFSGKPKTRDFAEKKAGTGIEKFLENKPQSVAEEKKFSEQSGLKSTAGSKSEKLVKDPSLVYLVRGKDKGRDAWHYVLVKRNLLQMFLKCTQGNTVDVAKFGDILFSGWGKDPPPEITAKIDRGEY